mmetsp:Transcript_35582/g.75985  ORF Transcript_35582/g.75985 Transcript_35582/m.75985 type:complete len:871 (-) Transcript_35582:2008-4620(-)
MSKPKNNVSSPAPPSASAAPKQPQPKAKSLLQSVFSVSSLSSFAAAFYVYFAFSNLLNLMYPLRNVPEDILRGTSNDRMVFPFWNWGEDGGTENHGELGLRVYLSSEPEFSLDYFSRNDEFGEDGGGRVEDGPKHISDGKSFLLWSEDNALQATKASPSRSFVLVASDDPSSSSSYGSCIADKNDDQTCSDEQKSLEYAHKWLEDSIQHEKQLQSDGGGLMAAMNSAGGGIESTSVLLTFYTSLHRTLKHMMESAMPTIAGGGDDKYKKELTKKKTAQDVEEPKSVIRVSPRNPLWKSLMSNGNAYVHVLLVRQIPSSPDQPHLLSTSTDARSAKMRLQQLHSQHNVLFGTVGMMKRELPLHVPSPKRLLYRDLLFVLKKYLACLISDDGSCSTLVPPWNVAHHQTRAQEEYTLARKHKKDGVKYPYWKPEVRIHLIQDDVGYPLDYANRVGFDIVQVGGKGRPRNPRHASGYAYLPAVHVDEIGLTSDKYVPLNGTVSALPLRIGFHSGMLMETENEESSLQQGLTPARYRLLNHLSASLESQAEMGFEQSDIDDLRRLIAETNVMLLAITILASVFHLLFEFLTFKSDVDFWRGNTDLTGLSVRALFLDWMSQVVILFYLIEMDSSLLMTVPTGVGVLIALWKCQRGAGLKFVKSSAVEDERGGKAWYNKLFGLLGYELCATRLRSATSSSDKPSQDSLDKPNLAALTEEMDQLATRLLGKYFLLPLVVSFAVYSLVKEPHSGWYSWFITTASSFVYAIGFVLMTPQLFLNYKLKSVAHLPWRVLGYRFVNTFIDDLFAFIIRMPTMARMSCFRDDVVFIIYLWQRYLYPVDASRPVEGGGVGDVASATVDAKPESENQNSNGKKKQS